jgi:hypothetical protein
MSLQKQLLLFIARKQAGGAWNSLVCASAPRCLQTVGVSSAILIGVEGAEGWVVIEWWWWCGRCGNKNRVERVAPTMDDGFTSQRSSEVK